MAGISLMWRRARSRVSSWPDGYGRMPKGRRSSSPTNIGYVTIGYVTEKFHQRMREAISMDSPSGWEMAAIAVIYALGGLLAPVVVLEVVTETSMRAPSSGDRADLLNSHLLASGWTLMR